MTITATGLVRSRGIHLHDHRRESEGELHYFVAGRARFRNAGQEYEQIPGSLFYSRPEELHASETQGEVPGVFFFVRFQTAADEELNSLLSRVFPDGSQANVGKGFQLVFEEIRQRASSPEPLFRKAAEHRLYGLLCELAGGRTPLPTAGQTYVNGALEMMQSAIHGTLDLTTIAGKLGIDPSYFTRIFHQAVGMSPMRYYMGLKVETARFLLVQTRLPMAQIAVDLAFRDEYHFSHTIRKTTGYSPTQIRRGKTEQISSGPLGENGVN